MSHRVRLVVVAGPLFFLLLSAQAQVRGYPGRNPSLVYAPYPYVEGTVLVGDQHSPLAGAVVRILDRTNKEVARTYTNSQGEFSFYQLTEQTYTIVVSHPDYQERGVAVPIFAGPVSDLPIRVSPKEITRAPAGAYPIGVWAMQVPASAKQEYEEGLKELEEGDGAKSADHFRAAISFYPDHAAAHSALGTALLHQGKADEARAAFEQALKIDENLPDACLGLGSLFSAESRYEEAEKLLLRARLLKPGHWSVEFELGQLYWRMGDWAKAEPSLLQARELHEEFPRTHLLLINVLALQEKYPETLAAMEHYLRLFPKDQFAEQVQRKHDLLKAELEKSSANRPQ